MHLGGLLSTQEARVALGYRLVHSIVRGLYDKNSASYSTVSPQMECINDIKGWFTRTQICWQDSVK